MTTAQSADIQARLNILCQDLITFFTEAGVEKHSIDLLQEKIDAHDAAEFMNICAAYGKCMAFIDHDVLHARLATGLSLLDDGVNVERKMVIKKIRALEGDKNADQAILAKLQQTRMDLDLKKVKTSQECLKYKFMVTVPMQSFVNSSVKEVFKENREAGYAACKHTTGKQKH